MLSRYSYLMLAGLSVLSKTVRTLRIQMNQLEHIRSLQQFREDTQEYPSWIINFPSGKDALDAMDYFCSMLEDTQSGSYCLHILTKYKFAEAYGTEDAMIETVDLTMKMFPMLGPIDIEQDQELTLSYVQESAPRNLDLISLPVDESYEYKCTGKGTHLYVLDTGVRYDHDDFLMPDGPFSRVVNEYSTEPNMAAISDCQGHGTHISSIAAGLQYGVAKNATIHAVKIFGCSTVGRMSSLLAGLDAIGDNMEEQSVILLSMGGRPSQSLESTLRQMDDEGIVVVGSAGNQNSDACEFSPSFIDTVLSVGASSYEGTRLTGNNGLGSNFGACVDVYAPGEEIEAASNEGISGTRFLSGTSQSAPHAAGVALLLREKFPDATPAVIREIIRSNLVNGILQVPDVDCTIEAQQITTVEEDPPSNGLFDPALQAQDSAGFQADTTNNIDNSSYPEDYAGVEQSGGVGEEQVDNTAEEEPKPRLYNGLFTRQVSQRAKTQPQVEDDSDDDSDFDDGDGGTSAPQNLWRLYFVQNRGGRPIQTQGFMSQLFKG